MSALKGLKVVDFTHLLAGPYATMILADLGAEVIKVEPPPTGDQSRTVPPWVGDKEAVFFVSINRGKKSVTIDLKRESGQKLVLDLISTADIVTENFKPGTMERLGLGYDRVKELNPRIIYGSISGFGHQGSMQEKPAVDLIVQAMGGMMSITGEPGGPPVRPGASLGDIIAGLHLVIALLAALRERDVSGEGQAIDISMLDCQVAVLENAYVRYFATGETPQPVGSRHPLASPAQAFPTKDGYIAITLRSWGVENQWPLFCNALDIFELADDPRFQDSPSRLEHHDILEPILNDVFKRKRTAEWVDILEPIGVACGPLNTIPMAARMPVMSERQMFTEVQHPEVGSLKVVNSPLKLSRTPGRARGFSPILGQDNVEIIKSLPGKSDEDIESLQRDGTIWKNDVADR